MYRTLTMGLLTMALCAAVHADEVADRWIRAGLNASRPVWGLREGIMVGVWPAAIAGEGDGGPRGLLRIGYPLGPGGRHELVNFIAVEPDVADGNWRGLSELEESDLDKVPGKRFTAEMPPDAPVMDHQPGVPPGCLDRPPDNPAAERLRVVVRVERFANAAHILLTVTLRSDRPDEVVLEASPEPDSRAIKQCVLTATMGNYGRLRRAHLAGGAVISAKDLFPGHTGHDFTHFRTVPLAKLARTRDGGVIVPLDGDEAAPAANWPHDPGIWWRWPWAKVTQYWRKAPGTFGEELCFAANGRVQYYGGGPEIPGGVAYENAELREDCRAGRPTVFGITKEKPATLLAR